VELCVLPIGKDVLMRTVEGEMGEVSCSKR